MSWPAWLTCWYKSGLKGDVMGKAFERIKQGLTEAIGHAKGTQAGVKVWRPAAVDVAAVRGRRAWPPRLHPGAVCGTLRRVGGHPAALGAWRPHPQGPALVLLNLIDRDPVGVLRGAPPATSSRNSEAGATAVTSSCSRARVPAT